VYRNSDIVAQIVGLEPFGGEDLRQDDVEWALHKIHAIEDCELEEDPRETRHLDEDDRDDRRNRGFVRSDRRRGDHSDDDDDDDDDRKW
jgi:hypothetical protein